MSSAPDWMNEGSCAGASPGMWFPENFDVKTGNRAKAICRACPVRLDCLRHALASHERHGIWGGINMANGFARKGLHPGLPDDVLEQAAQGHNPLNNRRTGTQRKSRGAKSRAAVEARERDVERLAGEGRTAVQIAAHLGITPKAAKKIAARIGVVVVDGRGAQHLTPEDEAEIPGMVLSLVEAIERRRRAS